MIEVEAPDGTIVEFPDGTSNDVMRTAMQKRWGGPQPPAPSEPSGLQPSIINDIAEGAYSAIPFSDEIVSGAMAPIRAAGDWVQGKGFDLGRSYQEGMDKEKATREEASERSPVAYTGGQIAGGLALAAPQAKAGVSLLQGAKPTLGSLVGRGAAEGAIYGGAYGAGEGQGRDRIDNALFGAETGGAVGGALGVIARAGAHRTASPVSRAAADDGLDAASVQQRLSDLGPDAMLMDLGPNLQRQAGALAASPGRAQEIVRNAIMGRDRTANARIRSEIDATLGPAPVPSQVEAGIRGGQQALSPAYQQVFRGARAVDTTPVAQRLETAEINLRGPAQRAARDIRQMLNVAGQDALDPNPGTLFQVRQAIDGMMATNVDPNAARLLASTRQQVDDLLGRAVPGIKDVDAQFAELARQSDALGRGQQVLASGREAPRPQELAQEIAEGALPQGNQIGPSAAPFRMRQGARDEIERIVGTTANDRVALQRLIKGEGDWNRERLASLFGPDKAERIIRVLDRERAFAETSHIVTRNSETAARSAAMREVGANEAPNFGVREGYMSGGMMGAARSGAVRAAERVKDALLGARREASNVDLAEALSSGDVARVSAALMRGQPQLSDAKRAIVEALTRGSVQQIGAHTSP